MGWLRKVVASSGGASPLAVGPWRESCGFGEVAWEFLTRTVWDEDGSKRETGTILLFADAGGLKAMLNDRDGSRVAFLTIGPEEAIQQAVEDALLSTGTDWRPAKKNTQGKR
jgi:hypothetical protein